MKINNKIIFFLFFTLLMYGLNSCKEEVKAYHLSEEIFKNPTDEYKPKTWYFIMNQNMTKEGFTKDLEAIAEVGIGGILVFNVTYGLPKGDVEFNSEKHREILAHAAKECERLGLSFGIHNSDGWTASGGPWVKPEQAMKIVVHSEKIIEGGNNINIQLPKPPSRHGYYEEIAVLAYPTMASEYEDATVLPSITASDPNFNIEIATDKHIDKFSNLNPTNSEKAWIQYDFKKPFTIRTLELLANQYKVNIRLLKSDDGEHFTAVYTSKLARIGKHEGHIHSRIKPITSRFFRIEVDKPLGIYNINLLSTDCPDNMIGLKSYRRLHGNSGKADPSMVIDKQKMINLTKKVDKNGRLTTNLPNGKWTILRFGFTASGATNVPASKKGTGLEVDKLSKAALKVHYDAYVGKVTEQAKAVAPNATQYAEIDSYEVGPQNWTNNLDSIFRQTYEYDIIPFLPVYAGKFVESGVDIDAVFWDMRKLLNETMVKNYYDYFTELCHKDGLISYIEPYGPNGFTNDMDVARNADVAMGEFWVGRPWDFTQAAISTAHIYGKNIIASESFTSTDYNWSVHPALIKTIGDYNWSKGFNQFIFHRFTHQSNTHVKPGMSMHLIGTHIDRTQTWWNNAGKAWFKYLSRGQYMLRQGIPVRDFLVFTGETAPIQVKYNKNLVPKGFSYDCVNADVIQNRLSAVEGKLKTPEGIEYKALVLPKQEVMTLETLRSITKLAKQGVIIIGKKPSQIAGYLNTKDEVLEFEALVRQTWQLPNCYDTFQWDNIFRKHNIQKDVIVEGIPDFKFNHRRKNKTDIYFIYNEHKKKGKLFHSSFLVDGKVPEIWYPSTGKIVKIAEYKHENGRTIVPIYLEPQESAFMVFRQASNNNPLIEYNPDKKDAYPLFVYNNGLKNIKAIVDKNQTLEYTEKGKKQKTLKITDIDPPFVIDGTWNLSFRKEDGYETRLKIDSLFDWRTHPLEQIKHYSGTAIYKKTFTVNDDFISEDKTYTLNLGQVHVVAKVTLNGADLGVKWIEPFVVDITKHLKAGNNELIIELTNQWGNRLIGDEKLPNQTGYELRDRRIDDTMPEWFRKNLPMPEGPRTTFAAYTFYKANDTLFPSGLLGPVKIEVLKNIDLNLNK
ncbi:glycoside hydrolase [Seonamhaeicola sediminis]|uniref:Glycoside hydrolase n=1 Tax=Seonamhaeicola sediminis TaxID=2528206 RepID=A0A562YHL8_9FLAO|nr:glycosyl hydrolase [Seonamhaeicola sediminis]TWO34570.1 glycoside hydrolase [Seonamhaeicola sediminis]